MTFGVKNNIDLILKMITYARKSLPNLMATLIFFYFHWSNPYQTKYKSMK